MPTPLTCALIVFIALGALAVGLGVGLGLPKPTEASLRPSTAPSALATTLAPTTHSPTLQPGSTLQPTLQPTRQPTNTPTNAPTRAPGIRLFTLSSAYTGADLGGPGRAVLDTASEIRAGALGYSCSQARALISDNSVTISNLASSFSFSPALAVYGATANALIASSWTNFLAGTFSQSMTAAGLPSGYYWSGGRTGADRCSDWSTTSGSGTRGNMGATSQSGAFDDASVACSSTLYIVGLCVET